MWAAVALRGISKKMKVMANKTSSAASWVIILTFFLLIAHAIRRTISALLSTALVSTSTQLHSQPTAQLQNMMG